MTFRPVLRPGASLLRRDATHLQIGTSPGIVFADRPGLMAMLRLLDGTRDVARLIELLRSEVPEFEADTENLLRELLMLGVVFDASRRTMPPGGTEGMKNRRSARSAPPRSARRTTYGLAFHADAPSRPVIDIARAVVNASGIADTESDDPCLLVIASCGEPSRGVFDQPARHGIDHLPLIIDEDRIRIGPLVRPGRTPCISCHDLHRADWDPAWPALLPQFGRHTGSLTPPAVDAVTTHAAAIELAVEVLAHCGGTDPRTLGQCLVVGPGHDQRAWWPVAFHHACACHLLGAA